MSERFYACFSGNSKFTNEWSGQYTFTPFINKINPFNPTRFWPSRISEVKFEELFFIDDDLNRKIFNRYYKYSGEDFRFIGHYELKDVQATDNWGLVYSPQDKIIVVGWPGFGWSPDHLSFLGNNGFLRDVGDGAYEFVSKPKELIRLEGKVALLSFPGALTFGHWFIDILGRIEILRQTNQFEALEYFLLPAPYQRWMRPFIEISGLPKEKIRLLNKETTYQIQDLIVPTTMSQAPGGVLPEYVLAPMYSRIGRITDCLTETSSSISSGPLLLKHTALTSSKDRVIQNFSHLAECIYELGGTVIDPLNVSIGELIHKIREASLVVGQDSSALHNVCFAPKDLLVIESEQRFNLLHPAISRILGTRLAFIQSTKTEDGWVMPTQRFVDAITAWSWDEKALIKSREQKSSR